MEYQQRLHSGMEHIACTGQDGTGMIKMPYEAMRKQVVRRLAELRTERRTLYFIGNGGSAAIAIHMTGDFLSNGNIRTHSMHDPATLTCLANDFGYATVFSRQLERAADKGDMLAAISSSGQSENILQAVRTARKLQCQVMTLSGFREDNPLRQMGDWNFYVPSGAYGIVESIHNMILQQIVDELMAIS